MAMDTADVIDPATYATMFQEGHKVSGPFTGVCGRVVRGTAPAEFSRLSALRGRRLAWLTGPDGLRSFVGRTGVEVLRMIGKYDQVWLERELAKGMQFKLIVMPQAECRRADWDGVFDMVEAHYPEIAPKLCRWRERLRDLSLVAEIGADLVADAVKSHPEHADHMSVERYMACEDTARNARLFLWHSLGMNEQYVGDGYAAAASGARRLDEYLAADASLNEIPGVVVIDLSVECERSAS